MIKKVFEEEKNNLEINKKKIDNLIEQEHHTYKYNKEEIDDIPSNDYEYLSYKRDLMLENQKIIDKINFYKVAKKNPYFGHMILTSNSEKIDMYIGEQSIANNSNHIVYDWRSPIASLFYLNQTKYKYNEFNYELELKRKLQIANEQLIKCFEIYLNKKNDEPIVDEFLLDILVNKRNSNEFVDIIKTIQEKQNEIIRFDKDKHMIIQGIAGSGKTAIIVHRLSYLLFNYPDIEPNKFLFIAPTNIFKEKLNSLNKKLQIDKIPLLTITEYYSNYIKKIFDNNVNDNTYLSENELDDQNYNKLKQEIIAIFTKKSLEEILIYSNELKININEIQNKNIYSKYKFLLQEYEKRLNDEKIKIKYLVKEISKWLKNIEQEVNTNFKNTNSNFKNSFMQNEGFNKNRQLIYYLDLIEKLINSKFNTKENNPNFEKYIESYKLINNNLKKQKNDIIIFIKSNNLKFNIKEKSIEDIINELNNYFKKKTKEITELKENLKILKEKQDKFKFKNVRIKEFNKLCIQIELETTNIERKETKISKLTNFIKEKELIIKENNNELLKIKKDLGINKLSILTYKEYFTEFSNFIRKIFKYQGYMNLLDEDKKEILNIINIFYKKFDTHINDLDFEFEYNKLLNQSLSNINFNLIDKIIKNIDTIKDKLTSKYFLEIYKKIYNYIISKENIQISKKDKNFLLLDITLDMGYYSPNKTYSYIYIDEAQDYSEKELKLIYKLEPNAIFNIYGDLDQILNTTRINKNLWNNIEKNLNIKFNFFELKENYRNTTNVVDFCNNELKTDMIPIGNIGNNVEIKQFIGYNECINTIEKYHNCIVITNKENFKYFEKFGIKCYTIKKAKGLEFENVVIIEEKEWNKNMKYVAYTRSLNNLIIYRRID